jgi:Tfp pilus assembly protein PilF
MLDAAQPEVLEELDVDYVYTPTKAKKQTVASLKATIAQALEMLQAGDVDTAQCVLNEAIK